MSWFSPKREKVSSVVIFEECHRDGIKATKKWIVHFDEILENHIGLFNIRLVRAEIILKRLLKIYDRQLSKQYKSA